MGKKRLMVTGGETAVGPPADLYAFGIVLYVLAKVTNIPFDVCMRATLPFLVPLVVVLLLITFIPQLSMWLPTLVYR